MNDFLRKLALAHQKHEGWFKGSVSYRQNNPGNLRWHPYHKTLYNAHSGDYGFARFPTYQIGFKALKDDLRAKVTGHSAHIDYSSNPTVLDYLKVYAPKADRNDPTAYARAVVNEMNKAGYAMDIDTPLSEIASYIHKNFVHFQPKVLYRRLQRLLARAQGAVKRRLQRRIDRLT